MQFGKLFFQLLILGVVVVLAAVVLNLRLHNDRLLDRRRILHIQLAASDQNQNGNDSNPYLQHNASIINQHRRWESPLKKYEHRFLLDNPEFLADLYQCFYGMVQVAAIMSR